MSLISSAMASEPIKNWDALRSEIVEAIDEQCTKFPACVESVDPLTKVVERCEDIHLGINKRLYSFDSPPFTIQRVAELAQDGRKFYSTLPKYLGALQHTLSVNSVIDDFDDENLLKLIGNQTERDVVLEPIDWAKE